MLVMKFGGTSVTKPVSVAAIKLLVERAKLQQPILIVSALSGITDLLVRLSHTILPSEQQQLIELVRAEHKQWIKHIFADNQLTQAAALEIVDDYLNQLSRLLNASQALNQLQLHDSIVAFGELISACLISFFLNYHQLAAQMVSATECIVTNNHFGGADFIEVATRRKCNQVLLPLLNKGVVPVVTGFIGANAAGETTILGRGGSDYSAAIIGYALKASEIQIWTDVDGVYSADPRVIKPAKLLPQLSYQEAGELAMFGAKVLHPRTIQPAIKAGVAIRVLNTFNLDNQGTLITHIADNSQGLVKSITWKNSAPLINIYSANMFLSKGFLQKIFAVLARNNISVNLLSASEVSVSLTLDNIGKLDQALIELNKFAKADYIDGFGTISLVGEQIMNTPTLMQELFNTVQAANTPVQMLSYSASSINISMVIPSAKIMPMVNLLHQKLVEKYSQV